MKDLFDEQISLDAAKSFENLTINKNIPEDITEITIESDVDIHLPKFLKENKLLKSTSEARRLINSGGFKINDNKYENLDINSNNLINKTIQVGKRNFYRIIKK